MTAKWQETLIEKQVTYILNWNSQVILIENVPAVSMKKRVSSFSLHQQ